jgi:hypothetical protein
MQMLVYVVVTVVHFHAAPITIVMLRMALDVVQRQLHQQHAVIRRVPMLIRLHASVVVPRYVRPIHSVMKMQINQVKPSVVQPHLQPHVAVRMVLLKILDLVYVVCIPYVLALTIVTLVLHQIVQQIVVYERCQ